MLDRCSVPAVLIVACMAAPPEEDCFGVAAVAGSDWRPHDGAMGFAQRRERMLDTLADALEEHVDIDALLALTRVGVHA